MDWLVGWLIGFAGWRREGGVWCGAWVGGCGVVLMLVVIVKFARDWTVWDWLGVWSRGLHGPCDISSCVDE